MRKRFILFTLCLAAFVAPASASWRDPLPDDHLFYAEGEWDFSSVSADFLATTGILVVNQEAPETVEWAVSHGFPAAAPFYPALYSVESGDFEGELQRGRSVAATAQKKRMHSNRNAGKLTDLRKAEDKLVKFLKQEGLVVEDGELPVSGPGIAALIASWGALSDNQADAKMSKYNRLLRPVIMLGGSELDLFDVGQFPALVDEEAKRLVPVEAGDLSAAEAALAAKLVAGALYVDEDAILSKTPEQLALESNYFAAVDALYVLAGDAAPTDDKAASITTLKGKVEKARGAKAGSKKADDYLAIQDAQLNLMTLDLELREYDPAWRSKAKRPKD